MTENELQLKDKVKRFLDIAVQLNQCNAAAEINGQESEPRSRYKLFALTLKAFKNEFEKLHDLLEELSMFYNQNTDIDSALQILPETGQLLGRLCSIPMFTSDPGCYMVLMKCIFSIYKCQPVTSLETAAKEWALSQLRSSLTSKEEDLTTRKFGIDVTEIQQVSLSQIVEELTTIIKNNSRQCDTQELILLATLFSAYSLSPELSPLLETILEQLSQYPLNEDILTLYHSLTVSQKNVYSSKEHSSTLSYKSLLHLWKSYLPSLEQEVLGLIQATTTEDRLLLPEMRVVVDSRHLPRACAENNQICHTVYKIFRSLIFQSPNCRTLIDVYTVLSELVYDNRQKCEVVFSQDRICHSSMQTLMNLLRIQISDLSALSSERHISCIACEIHKLSGQDRANIEIAEIWLCLQLYKSWYYKAILLCLTADVRVQDSCITVILFYHDCEIQTSRQSSLTHIVNSLRLLLSKCNLKQQDLQYAISANQHPEDVILRTVIGQLLIVMLLHSVAGVKLAKEILSMACPGSIVKDMVYSLVQMPVSLRPDMTKWSVYKMKEFKDTLLKLVQLTPEHEEKLKLMKIVHKYLNQC